jgi:hypothetical protein
VEEKVKETLEEPPDLLCLAFSHAVPFGSLKVLNLF